MRRFLILVLMMLMPSAWALPALELGGLIYVSLVDVAREMGYIVSESAGSLTVRAGAGVLVVFEDSPDLLWKASASGAVLEDSDVSLSAPVLRRKGVWYAPAELLALFEMRVEGGFLVLPAGRRVGLEFPPLPPQAPEGARSARVELGNGVYALALFGPGEGSSLLLADAGLLSLAFPQQQAAVDAFMARVEGGKPLYFVVTAVVETSWDTSVEVSQGGRTFEARHPFSLSVLAGEAGRVSPEVPVSGVILLPEWVNLRRPLMIRWEGAEAGFQFRR